MSFPDISGTDGITVTAKSAPFETQNFTLSIVTWPLEKGSWRAAYRIQHADSGMPGMETFLPYSSFGCFDDDGSLMSCGSLTDQLGSVTQIGLDKSDDGQFRVALSSVSAVSRSAVLV